jgi:hypothetical protein
MNKNFRNYASNTTLKDLARSNTPNMKLSTLLSEKKKKIDGSGLLLTKPINIKYKQLKPEIS